MFPERLETERLALTPLTSDHVDPLDFYELCSADAAHIEEVTESLPWEPHQTPKETKKFLDGLGQQWSDAQNAEYAVRVRPEEDDEIAGAVGLNPDWDRRTGELGIWLRKPFWGRGYYGEAFAELTRVAFERLDLELVEILHKHGNEKSQRATEKFTERFGGRHEGRFRNLWSGPEVADAHRYTISQAEYEQTR
ncbi:GNAT family N-acetyltransferase [Halorussus halophilus]|uniref:GNAT family N-acetyltransferase n=1 Tax=Halorussus halophilus TaxID=2650975 RepID=UPI0013018999|nr:GNAT family N-acetyltransferase [Halorussus halophilus]